MAAKKKAAPAPAAPTTVALGGQTVTVPASFGAPTASVPPQAPTPAPAPIALGGQTVNVPSSFAPPPVTAGATSVAGVKTQAEIDAENALANMAGGLSDQLLALYPELKTVKEYFVAQNYTAAQNALKQTQFYQNNSPAAISILKLKLEQPGVYKQQLDNYINNVKRYSTQSGFKVDDATLKNVAEKAFTLGYDANSQEARNLFDINFTLDKVKGGNALIGLTNIKNTALANGYSDADYKTNVSGWLDRLKNGEDINAIQQEIRNAAALGRPETVRKMMESGTDLQSILNPYKNILYQTLEINPETISLNDPRLNMALNGAKEMTLTDYQRALRKDPMWQYTNNARQEAASVANRVLRDFGFQG